MFQPLDSVSASRLNLLSWAQYVSAHQQVKFKAKVIYDRLSVSQSALVSGTHLGQAINFSGSYGFVDVGAPSDERSGPYLSVVAGPRQRSFFFGLSPAGLMSVVCLNF
jgi:hypothetical protein